MKTRPPPARPALAFYGHTLLDGTGGLQRYARAAVDALRSGPLAGRFRVYLPSCRRDLAPAALADVVEFFPAPDPRRGFSFANLFWSNLLALHLRRKAPDAVFYAPFECQAFLPLRRPVLTSHDCYGDRFGAPSRGGRPGAGRRLLLAQMRRSRLLAVSRFTARELAELHGLKPPAVETVPNWLSRDFDPRPPETRVADLRARLGLPPRFWLYLGGYRLNKNLPMLFEAYEAASARRPLPPLVLAGKIPATDTPFTGPLFATLDRLPAIRDAVLRIGHVAEEDLPALYKLASLVVCPSFYEGFGYPVIEAAAVGTPLIAARATSFLELVTEPERLFSSEEPSELTARLLSAADGETRFAAPLDPAHLPAAGEARFNSALARALG